LTGIVRTTPYTAQTWTSWILIRIVPTTPYTLGNVDLGPGPSGPRAQVVFRCLSNFYEFHNMFGDFPDATIYRKPLHKIPNYQSTFQNGAPF